MLYWLRLLLLLSVLQLIPKQRRWQWVISNRIWLLRVRSRWRWSHGIWLTGLAWLLRLWLWGRLCGL